MSAIGQQNIPRAPSEGKKAATLYVYTFPLDFIRHAKIGALAGDKPFLQPRLLVPCKCHIGDGYTPQSFVAATFVASLSNRLLALQRGPGCVLVIIDVAIPVRVNLQPHTGARLDHDADRPVPVTSGDQNFTRLRVLSVRGL